MMKIILLLFSQFFILNALLHSKKFSLVNTTDHRTLVNVKIYSNLAEVIQPLGKLPLEFSVDDWSDIRSDSITLVGSNVNVTQQTMTEKKLCLNNLQLYIRSPSSTQTETKFVKATMIDESRNLVKCIDKDISKEPIFLTVQSHDIVYIDEPSPSKYYVNFIYNTTGEVHLSYLRSNLNWKTRYQLNLFEESKQPVIIAMADIRNDGKSRINIEHAELIGGDINLRMFEHHRSERYELREHAVTYASANTQLSGGSSPASVSRGEEIAGLYVFSINQPLSIDAKTNYLLHMFRPQVAVERYGLIRKSFFSGVGNSFDKVQRSYRLSSDRFLSRGNCILREYDRLVGEILLPDLAAKDKHEFSIGQDADVVYRENVTLLSSHTFNETLRSASKEVEERTQTIYMIHLSVKNFKKNRSVKVEYRQEVYARSVKLTTSNGGFVQDGTIIKSSMTLSTEEEKVLSYKMEMIS
ncbi:hypothetical protein I4U23_000377 [Adineta vaga]|nr:hypothetical protein I4U23_000377 [Adineta vaga]